MTTHISHAIMEEINIMGFVMRNNNSFAFEKILWGGYRSIV